MKELENDERSGNSDSVVAGNDDLATQRAGHERDVLLSDEELDEVYGGVSLNWEIDW